MTTQASLSVRETRESERYSSFGRTMNDTKYIDGCTLQSGEIMTYRVNGLTRIHVQISTASSCCVRIVIEEYNYIAIQTAHYRYYSSIVWKRLGHVGSLQ